LELPGVILYLQVELIIKPFVKLMSTIASRVPGSQVSLPPALLTALRMRWRQRIRLAEKVAK
jgi:hypothetical protein